MSINVSCNCGRVFEVPSFMAGQEVTCSKCGLQLVIPKQDAVPESLDRGATLKRLRCPKCGNTIKITTGRTFKGVQCAACGTMVGLDGSPSAPAPEPKPPTDAHRPPSGPHAVPASSGTSAFDQREKEPTVKGMPAIPLKTGGANSQIVDCGSCGKMYAVTESKCPYCFTPKGVGGKTRGSRQGSYYADLLMSVPWGAKGVLQICARFVALTMASVLVIFLMAVFGAQATSKPAQFFFWIVVASYWGHLCAISFQVIRAGAARTDPFPPLPSPFDLPGNLLPLLQVSAWAAATLGPSLLFLRLAVVNNGSCLLGAMAALLFLAGAPVFVLGYVAIAVHESLFRVSPLGIVKALVRHPVPILALIGMVLATWTALSGTIVGVHFVLALAAFATANPLFVALLGIAMTLPLGSFVMIGYWRMLGIFYYHHEDKVELVRRGE